MFGVFGDDLSLVIQLRKIFSILFFHFLFHLERWFPTCGACASEGREQVSGRARKDS